VSRLPAIAAVLVLIAAADPACRGSTSGASEPAPSGPAVPAPAEREAPPRLGTLAIFENPDGTRASFRVEIAATPEQRERGLMFRRELEADRGMVFVFPQEEVQTFWMKNTYIPLDMIFLASDGRVVGIVENARPLTLDPRTVEAAAGMVVEIPAFGARRAGIRPGSRARFDPPLPGAGR